MNFPKITIVTPSFNQGVFIEETILSIINQNYPNLEYIIIDGGSTDNTIEIIKKYEKHITYWISEKDDGQADAINKGMLKASGVLFNWINSDDILIEGTLNKIAKLYSEEIGCYCGSVINFNINGDLNIIYNTNISYQTILNGTFSWHQPGVWFRKDVLNNIKISSDYHFAFDYKMMLDIFKKEITTIYCGDIFVKFRLHASSKTISHNLKFCDEYLSILENYSKRTINGSDKKVDKHIDFFMRIKFNYGIIDPICYSNLPTFMKRIKIIEQILFNPLFNFNRYTFSKLIFLK